MNEVPRKEAGCQPGSVTHRRLFPRVLGTETLEKLRALVCQSGGAFLEERMLRDQGSKEETEERTELNSEVAMRGGLQELLSIPPLWGCLWAAQEAVCP